MRTLLSTHLLTSSSRPAADAFFALRESKRGRAEIANVLESFQVFCWLFIQDELTAN